MIKHYAISVRCGNCHYEGVIEIPAGQTVKMHPCPICKCMMLETSYGAEGHSVIEPKKTKGGLEYDR